MLHIPIVRSGKPYESIERVGIVHHATGDAIAELSLANSGLIVRDVSRMPRDVLERFTVAQLVAMCEKAAGLFMNATLPIGDQSQSFDDYVEQISATTGMPITYCKTNAEKIQGVLAEMGAILSGLTRGLDLGVLDSGCGRHNGHTLSFFREGRIFGAVLPSNSPGVHGLWIPAIALKTPIVLKPGREEPWTPFRIIEALAAAGVPREAFGFYPTDHAGANELIRAVDRAMVFGDASTTRPWRSDSRVEIHGPGFSKVVLGDDVADDWERHLDLIESSIVANCGRSCINASSVWTPKNGQAIAKALAKRLAKIEARPADDPDAAVAAFANQTMAESISAVIDHDLKVPGAGDLTALQRRGKDNLGLAQGDSGRLVVRDRCSFLLPTIIWCEYRGHPLANREFLFPYASVVECATAEMAAAVGSTLIVTAITKDQRLIDSLMAAPNVDRLNIGPIPTWSLSWDQPHEGNLFEHLYRQRALQLVGQR